MTLPQPHPICPRGVPALPGTTTFTAEVADVDGRIASALVRVTVGGCDRTITGPHAGALTVTTGVVCLDQVAQAGRVTVAGNAVLVVVGSIRGGITASNAADVTLCGADVTGRVHTGGTTGRVLIDPAGCPASEIDGG